MFDESFTSMLGLELPDESWVPQLTGNPQVFAAPHHCVGFATFGRSRDAIFIEVVLFSASDRYKSVWC